MCTTLCILEWQHGLSRNAKITVPEQSGKLPVMMPVLIALKKAYFCHDVEIDFHKLQFFTQQHVARALVYKGPYDLSCSKSQQSVVVQIKWGIDSELNSMPRPSTLTLNRGAPNSSYPMLRVDMAQISMPQSLMVLLTKLADSVCNFPYLISLENKQVSQNERNAIFFFFF